MEISKSKINPDTDFKFNTDTVFEDSLLLISKLPYYAENYAYAKSIAEKTAQELKNIEALAYLEIRKQAREKGEKLTELSVSSLVASDLSVGRQHDALTAANEELYYAEGYWRSVQKACDIIQMLGYAKTAEMKRI